MLEPLSISPFCLPGPAVLGRRILVVGSTCSGKTTLAGRLAGWLELPHIELDRLHWGPNWMPVPLEEFRAQVLHAVSVGGWVVDGNYRAVRDLLWPRVDTFVWLDYSLSIILFRLLKRSMKRIVTQEALWNDNRETMRGVFFSRDSLILWALSRFRNRRLEYRQLFNAPEYQHVTRIVLPNPHIADCFCAVVRSRIIPLPSHR